MRKILPITSAIALLIAVGAAPALAQSPADQRADRIFGDYTDTGMVQNVDEIGNIIEVDGVRYLVDEGVNIQDINVGDQVMVRFEQSALGTELVAVEVQSVE